MNNFAKKNQEQAVAAWVNYLNQLRIDTLLSKLVTQDIYLDKALGSIDGVLKTIRNEIVDRNRGGLKGMHGFIAEVAEMGVGNAKQLILGQEATHQLLNDNGPVDLVINARNIQQKFSMAGGRFSLDAVLAHKLKYPDFLQGGGVYQLPRDHFDAIQTLVGMSEGEAMEQLVGGDWPFSMRQWRRVNDFVLENDINVDTLRPSTFEYQDVQRGVYEQTLAQEKEGLKETDRAQRQEAYDASKPTVQEGAKATLGGGAIEGVTALVLAIRAKRKMGKQLRDFDATDWQEIMQDAGFGSMKGGVRGLSLYVLMNFTATPAAVASAIVTASFSIAEQAHLLRGGEISELEFVENSELLSLDAALSALSSLVGQAVIPLPIIGAVIGNSIGQIMYSSVSSALSEREACLIEEYAQTQRELDERLEGEHADLLSQFNESLADYLALLDAAFSPDPIEAFLGSIELARSLGVPTEDILDSDEKTITYFMD